MFVSWFSLAGRKPTNHYSATTTTSRVGKEVTQREGASKVTPSTSLLPSKLFPNEEWHPVAPRRKLMKQHTTEFPYVARLACTHKKACDWSVHHCLPGLAWPGLAARLGGGSKPAAGRLPPGLAGVFFCFLPIYWHFLRDLPATIVHFGGHSKFSKACNLILELGDSAMHVHLAITLCSLGINAPARVE